MANKLAIEAGEQDFADEKYWREAAQRLGVLDYREKNNGIYSRTVLIRKFFLSGIKDMVLAPCNKGG